MADSRSKRRGEDLPLPPRPPRRPPQPPQQPRGQTEEEILRDRSGLDSRFREPMMTNEDPGYIMGGPQMTDPYNFEYMRRQKEKRESEGIRLKKGGPVKKYEGGGMVEIEIKVGGGKRKGMHKMPDGSMMEDSEHEAEEYRKGGQIRKYAEGGEVGNSDRPEERGPVGLYYNRLLRDRRANKAREKEFEPDLRLEQIVLGAKKAARGPSAGGPERLAREAAEDATRRRNRTAFYQGTERELEGRLDREGARIGQRRDPTRVEDNGYKKGGMVKAKAKAPVKKAMGGKVAAKPMGKPVMKKAGGRVAAKPMMKGRKK